MEYKNKMNLKFLSLGENESFARLAVASFCSNVGFDVEEISDINAVRRSYIEVGRREAEYRGASFSLRLSLEDTMQTALTISTEGKLGVGSYPDLKKGIEGLRQFVFSYKFGISHAVTHAARAAYVAACILYHENKLLRYDTSIDLLRLVIGKKPLDVLKKSNPEAFYYWYLVEKLRTEKEPAQLDAG